MKNQVRVITKKLRSVRKAINMSKDDFTTMLEMDRKDLDSTDEHIYIHTKSFKLLIDNFNINSEYLFNILYEEIFSDSNHNNKSSESADVSEEDEDDIQKIVEYLLSDCDDDLSECCDNEIDNLATMLYLGEIDTKCSYIDNLDHLQLIVDFINYLIERKDSPKDIEKITKFFNDTKK